jgi:hypothetical protein
MQIEHILITPNFMTIQDSTNLGRYMTGIKFTQKRLTDILRYNLQLNIEMGVYRTELERVKKAVSKTKYIIKSEKVNQYSNGYFDLELKYNYGA